MHDAPDVPRRAPDDELLPVLVRRYLARVLPDPDAGPRLVRLTQEGEMRSKPGGRPLAFRAVEELAVERVAFVWRARFPVAPLVSFAVVDRYEAGVGALDAKLWGLVPIARGRGPDFARGEAVRYLSELAWVPHALRANAELAWRELGGGAVEVATSAGSARIAVRLQFDEAGDIVSASTHARPRTEGKRIVETPWAGSFTGYQVVGGVRIPTRAEVRWELPGGPFTYWRARVVALEATNATSGPAQPSV